MYLCGHKKEMLGLLIHKVDPLKHLELFYSHFLSLSRFYGILWTTGSPMQQYSYLLHDSRLTKLR